MLDGKYAMAVQFENAGIFKGTGCVFRSSDGSFPQLAWISNDIREWCQNHDRAIEEAKASTRLQPRVRD